MYRTTVYLPEELKRALEGAAVASGRTEAEIVREALRRFVEEHGARPRLPLFASGQPDLASRVDELLRGFGER